MDNNEFIKKFTEALTQGDQSGTYITQKHQELIDYARKELGIDANNETVKVSVELTKDEAKRFLDDYWNEDDITDKIMNTILDKLGEIYG